MACTSHVKHSNRNSVIVSCAIIGVGGLAQENCGSRGVGAIRMRPPLFANAHDYAGVLASVGGL